MVGSSPSACRRVALHAVRGGGAVALSYGADLPARREGIEARTRVGRGLTTAGRTCSMRGARGSGRVHGGVSGRHVSCGLPGGEVLEASGQACFLWRPRCWSVCGERVMRSPAGRQASDDAGRRRRAVLGAADEVRGWCIQTCSQICGAPGTGRTARPGARAAPRASGAWSRGDDWPMTRESTRCAAGTTPGRRGGGAALGEELTRPR